MFRIHFICVGYTKIKNFQYGHGSECTLKRQNKTYPLGAPLTGIQSINMNHVWTQASGKFIAIIQANYQKAHFKQRGDKRHEIAIGQSSNFTGTACLPCREREARQKPASWCYYMEKIVYPASRKKITVDKNKVLKNRLFRFLKATWVS